MISQDQSTDFPIININNFVLREIRESDASDYLNYYGDPKVNKFILCDIPQNFEESRKEVIYWRNIFYYGEGIYFAIADKKDDRMIGSIGLTSHNRHNSRIELSYDLAKEYWRQGIMSDAIKQTVRYGFNIMKINRIEASVAVTNLASKELLVKLGFSIDGILRQHRKHNDLYRDVFMMSLLKDDLDKERCKNLVG